MSKSAEQKHHRQLVIGFLVCAILVFSLPHIPQIRLLDLKIIDRQFQFLRHSDTKQPGDEVVLIGIDEETYRAFPEPFALWHPYLGDMFNALAQVKPRVVGLDITLPDRSYNTVIEGNDQRLLQGMLAFRKVAPMVLGVTIEHNGKTRRVYPPFLSVAGKTGQAFVLWRLDSDRVVRRFDPSLGTGEGALPTLVGVMAHHLGREAGPGLIDFTLGTTLNYTPLQDVVRWYREGDIGAIRNVFAGKAVLVGTVLPFEDRHYQPVNLAGWEHDNDNFVPGVLLHVQALRSVLADGFIQPVGVTYVYLMLAAVLSLWALDRRLFIGLLVFALGAAALFVTQNRLLDNGIYLPVAATLLALLVVLAGRFGLEAGMQLMERRRLRRAFGGYVSPPVLEEILNGALEPGVHGENHYVCVLFSDIRNFTGISEKLSPEAVVSFLNRYFTAMTAAIQGNGGTVDKFIGDGIMAFFGAPKPAANPAKDAFAAAKAKLEKLDVLNAEFEREGGMPHLAIGIGLHMGDVVVGNVGSEERHDYTAIGDVVNTASRLEGLTKQAGYPIVVSAVVADALEGDVQFDSLGEMPVKGRAPVQVYGWPPCNTPSLQKQE